MDITEAVSKPPSYCDCGPPRPTYGSTICDNAHTQQFLASDRERHPTLYGCELPPCRSSSIASDPSVGSDTSGWSWNQLATFLVIVTIITVATIVGAVSDARKHNTSETILTGSQVQGRQVKTESQSARRDTPGRRTLPIRSPRVAASHLPTFL